MVGIKGIGARVTNCRRTIKDLPTNVNTAINLEMDGHVAWLVLCRPDRRNAMDMDFFKALTDHFRQLDRDEHVRVVVIRAEGKSFTAGLDLMAAGALLGGQGVDVSPACQSALRPVDKERDTVAALIDR